MDEATSRREYLAKLRQILAAYFNDGELRTVCFDLGVDYADLPGQGKADKARELVEHLEHRDRIPELVTMGRKLRPNVTWEPETRPVINPLTPGIRLGDVYSVYEVALNELLERLGQGHSQYNEALVYQQRLTENCTRSRRLGDNDTRKTDRAEIIDGLNGLAMSALGISFNEICEKIRR